MLRLCFLSVPVKRNAKDAGISRQPQAGAVVTVNNNAPVAFTTAKDGKNIQRAIDLAQHLFRQACALGDQGGCNVLQRYAK